MPVYVIDTLKPKNGLDFPVVEAVDVAVEGYTSLADAVTHFATQSSITNINAILATKASESDLSTATASLQAQIDAIVTPVTQDAEVQNARVSLDGTTYTSLKARLDANEVQAKNIEVDLCTLGEVVQGGIDDDGINIVSPLRCRIDDYIPYSDIKIKNSNVLYKWGYHLYDAEYNHLYGSPWITSTTRNTTDSSGDAVYMRFAFAFRDDSAIVPANVKNVYYIDKTIKSALDDLENLISNTDTEVKNARADADETNYPTLKARLDADAIKAHYTEIDLATLFRIEQGTIDDDGKNFASPVRCRTVGYVPYEEITVKNIDANFQWGYHLYDAEYNHLYGSPWITSATQNTTDTSGDAVYMRFAFAFRDISTIVPADVKGKVYIDMTTSYAFGSTRKYLYNLKDELEQKVNVSKDLTELGGVEQGGIDHGVRINSTRRCRSKYFIDFYGFVVSFPDDFKLGVQLYDDDHTNVYNSPWITSSPYTVSDLSDNENARYIQFVFAYRDDRELTPSDVIGVYSASINIQTEIKRVENKIDDSSNIPDGLQTYSYTGKINVKDSKLAYSSIGTVGMNTQGSAVYGDYLVSANNKRSMFKIMDLTTHTVVGTLELEPVDTYHCNNINFGTEKYDDSDYFPLLYVSMENINEHKCLVYRLSNSNDTWEIELVQTITYPEPAAMECYFPNAILDTTNDWLYIAGYKTQSYYKTPANKLVFKKFDMPHLSDGDVTLTVSDVIESFELPSMFATQGAFIYRNKVYQCYGVPTASTAPELFLGTIDLGAKAFDTIIDLEAIGITQEPEAVCKYKDDLLIVMEGGTVYQFYFD